MQLSAGLHLHLKKKKKKDKIGPVEDKPLVHLPINPTSWNGEMA